MSSGTQTIKNTGLAILAALVIAEVVSAYETTMAVQLLYANLPFFGSDIAQLTWIVTAYMLVAAAATAVCGRLGDQFGRTQVLTWVLIISAVGSLISAVAPNVGILILGRAVQGVSGAVLPLTIGLAREALPRKMITTGIAVIGASALIAGSAGMLVAGAILDHTNWRYIFVSAVVLAVLSVIGLKAIVPASRPSATLSRQRVDYFGAVLFSGGIAATLFGVTRSSEWGWGDVRTLGFLGAGLLVLAVWTAWELRIEAPMVELRRFLNPKFTLGMLATIIVAFGVFGMSQVFPTAVMRTPSEIPVPGASPIDLPVGLGLTATVTGLIGGAGALTGFALSPFAGRISQRHGAARTVIIGCLIAFCCALVLPLMYVTVPLFLLYTVVFAVAVSFAYGALPTLIAECVPESETSAAVGMQAVLRTTFQGVAASFAGVILAQDEVMVGDLAFLSETGIRVTAIVIAVCAVLGVIIAVLAARYRTSSLAEVPPVEAAVTT